MKIAASTLALPAFDHLPLLPRLAEMGVAGIEIAPAHTWPGPWRVVAAAAPRVAAAYPFSRQGRPL